MDRKSPTLSEVIKAGIEQRLEAVNIAMPGTIVSYSKADDVVNVKPAFKVKFKSDGNVIDLPIIANVPVIWPGSNTAFFRTNLTAGDTVQLLINQRSIDRWLSKGGTVDPEFRGKFQLSDAVAIPGLMPNTKKRTSSASYIELGENGTIEIKSSTGEELLGLIVDLIDAVSSLQVLDPSSGPLSTTPATQLALDAIKTRLEGIMP